MYRNKCMPLTQVHRLVSKFKIGKRKLKDKQSPGAPRTALTDANIVKIIDIINNNDVQLTIK